MLFLLLNVVSLSFCIEFRLMLLVGIQYIKGGTLRGSDKQLNKHRHINKVKPGLTLCWGACHPTQL